MRAVTFPAEVATVTAVGEIHDFRKKIQPPPKKNLIGQLINTANFIIFLDDLELNAAINRI